MAIEWMAALVTICAVTVYSQGYTRAGNVLQMLSAVMWIIVGLASGIMAIVVLNAILGGIALYSTLRRA